MVNPAQNLSAYGTFHEDSGIPEFVPEYSTPLPLPGEYIVLQLNPLAMTKHLGRVGLTKALRKLEFKKYLAIVSNYCETISIQKPWHMARCLLLYDEVESLAAPPGNWHAEGMVWSPLAQDVSHRHHVPVPKKRQQLQVIFVRLRTRLCELPRTNLIEVPAKTWEHVKMYGELWYTDGKLEGGTGVVDCWQMVTERAPNSSLMAWADLIRETYDPAEWETGTKLLRLCLIPHFDYSLDTNVGVSYGKDLKEEQALIIAMLRTAITEMPLKAIVPIRFHRMSKHDHLVDQPLTHSMRMAHGDPLWFIQKKERAKERQALQAPGWFSRLRSRAYRPSEEVEALMKASEDPERPDHHVHKLVFAPRCLEKVSLDPALQKLLMQEGPNLLDLVREPLYQLKQMFRALRSPETIYHGLRDAEPYIPFDEWQDLVDLGAIPRDAPPPEAVIDDYDGTFDL